jgi:adenine-specific DNA methylase
LIEEWLPAAAIGVECLRERGSASALAPTTYLHVWWARRPLVASRAAVLGSLLPADFPRDVFERLLGFWGSSAEILTAASLLESARLWQRQIENPHGLRAFRQRLREQDFVTLDEALAAVWQSQVVVVDPMAGGGSIPLESARMGVTTIANEYNPVACALLEATVDIPFRYEPTLVARARKWGTELRHRFIKRMEALYPSHGIVPPLTYIYARTIPCPDTGYPTPLVPDWHLLRPKNGVAVVAVPEIDRTQGTWTVAIREVGRGAGQARTPPRPTYDRGKGISLFSGRQIPADYIKAQAQAGRLGSQLYAVAIKQGSRLRFEPPTPADLAALAAAEQELARRRPAWEASNVIPTERIPEGDKTKEPLARGITRWADMFSPRQLLAMGVLVEELRALRPEIVAAEGEEMARAIELLLALVLDKFVNYNCLHASWHAPRQVIRSMFDRHDYSFKPTFAEMAACGAGSGLEWAIDNVLTAYEEIAKLPRHPKARPSTVTLGSATSLPQLADRSVTAVVVDPPYADNVQYSELADFFYVWLKRTVGHHHPDWFATPLSSREEEAVVNVVRHRQPGERASDAKEHAHAFYTRLMTDAFREAHRVLRDDGVLTVMFTHKRQDAWENLFDSLISAGFQITATWPIKTESEHSLHQANKNAAQSTVLLVCRKRLPDAGVGIFTSNFRQEIRAAARAAAERLQRQGLNGVDQLVGAFGPAMAVYSRYDTVRTDTGEAVPVSRAIDEAAEAVSAWREAQLSQRALEGVDAESRFVVLCWDVLGAGTFRFNEAKLLGHAVGMDVDQLVAAGLVDKSGEWVSLLPAAKRRRPHAIRQPFLGGIETSASVKRADAVTIHPDDRSFRTAIDACHALALAYLEAGGGKAGEGAARSFVRRTGLRAESPAAILMEALVRAAPPAVRTPGRGAAPTYPEFAAWHALLEPVFGITPPDWSVALPLQPALPGIGGASDDDDSENEDEAEE